MKRIDGIYRRRTDTVVGLTGEEWLEVERRFRELFGEPEPRFFRLERRRRGA